MNNGEYVDDFWMFDPSTESWTQLRDIADTSDDDYDDDYNIARMNGVAFVIDGAVYLTCGESGSLRSDTWKYYPANRFVGKCSQIQRYGLYGCGRLLQW